MDLDKVFIICVYHCVCDPINNILTILTSPICVFWLKFKADAFFYVFIYRENFLKVDIYYHSLTYQNIRQRAAFESLSLMSEIGGFLGLLLGASTLTLCELLDWFVLVVGTRCRNRGRTVIPESKSGNRKSTS